MQCKLSRHMRTAPTVTPLLGTALRERRALFPSSGPPKDESEEEEVFDEHCSHAPPFRAAGTSSRQLPSTELYDVLKRAATLLDREWLEMAPLHLALTIIF